MCIYSEFSSPQHCEGTGATNLLLYKLRNHYLKAKNHLLQQLSNISPCFQIFLLLYIDLD